MPLRPTEDPQVRLIQATIAFANGDHPTAAFGLLIAETRRRVGECRLQAFEDAAKKRHERRPDSDPMGDLRLKVREALLLNAIASKAFAAPGGDKNTRDSARGFFAEHIQWLAKGGPRALAISALDGRSGAFEEISVPLWTDARACALDGLALILGDYRDMRERVFVCPYGAPESIKTTREGLVRAIKETVISRELHFVADTRFAKGAKMCYCSPSHQRAHYMQQYRLRKRKAKAS